MPSLLNFLLSLSTKVCTYKLWEIFCLSVTDLCRLYFMKSRDNNKIIRMNSVESSIKKVLNKTDDFCCLCFSGLSEDLIDIEDEVYTSINDIEYYVSMSEILSTVFDYEVLDYIFTFKHICKACTLSAVSSYTFIKTTKINSERLTKSLNALLCSVENTREILNCSSLYLSLNTEDFTSQQYYDLKKPATTLQMALRRYNSLLNALTKTGDIKIKKTEPCENVKPKLHGNCLIPMSTKDMMAEKTDSIKCKDCHKIFNSKLNLRNHYIRQHSPKTYQCNECNKCFGSPSCLETHKNEKHCTIVCSKCGKTFKNKTTFKTHEMNHLLKLVCPDCGRVYKNKATYKKHIELNVCGQKTRASPANAKFTCDYCNKKYTQKVSLRVHIQYEHGNYKYHVCKVCNKKFWAQSRLKAHMVKHTKERNFSCTLCNGKFVTKEALLYHTRIHTGEKPYECPDCDARFLSASRRSDHVKRHHTNATLPCEICGSKFNSQNYLQKHKKGHFSSELTVPSQSVSDTVIPQKVTESEFKMLTQELKRIEEEEYKIAEMSDPDVYHLEFSHDDDDYTIQISALK